LLGTIEFRFKKGISQAFNLAKPDTFVLKFGRAVEALLCLHVLPKVVTKVFIGAHPNIGWLVLFV
jgi:hypothetical protein